MPNPTLINVGHRTKGQTAKLLVRVSAPTHSALKQYCEAYNLSIDIAIWDLIEFYRLQDLQTIIERIHAKYQAGLNMTERAQLSILYTMLGEINRISGL
jgi:hypothetical protein